MARAATAALLLTLLWRAAAGAQERPPRLPNEATGTVPADTAAVAEAKLNPRRALIRSALLPGWGQVAGGHPLKGALFGAAAAGLVGYAVAAQRDLDHVSDRLDRLRAQEPGSPWIPALETQVQDRAGVRNTRLLFVALCYTMAAVDAYVDAHLADFGDDGDLVLAPLPGRGPAVTVAWVTRF